MTLPENPSSKPLDLLVLAGDGIGPEIMAATLEVLSAVQDVLSLDIHLQTDTIGFKALEAEGTTFPNRVLEKSRAADGIILGTVQHNDYPPVAEGGVNPSGVLRRELDLFANIRPAKTIAGLPPRCGKPFDLVICRENTEGFYADRTMFMGPGELMPTPDLALAIRKVTRAGSTRIAEEAFKLAMQRRRKVTAVHKANVLRVSDGFFLQCVREVRAKYPEVEYEEQLMDAMAALLVRDASVFDVILATNMFGDILSDEATEIAGSIGLAASINASYERAMAQAQHGSAPDIAGRNKANPSSLIVSTAMLLQWLGERRADETLMRAATIIEDAVAAAIAIPEQRTADLGGPLGTSAFGRCVAGHAVEIARG